MEETRQRIIEKQEISLEDLKRNIQSLEESFTLIRQKWSLEILYTLFLKNTINFSQMKETLGVNSPHPLGQTQKPQTLRLNRRNCQNGTTTKS
jgi:DNA-binding HxlR family transcriptional regulator